MGLELIQSMLVEPDEVAKSNEDWRRERDSNPRALFLELSLSRRALLTTQSSLQVKF